MQQLNFSVLQSCPLARPLLPSMRLVLESPEVTLQAQYFSLLGDRPSASLFAAQAVALSSGTQSDSLPVLTTLGSKSLQSTSLTISARTILPDLTERTTLFDLLSVNSFRSSPPERHYPLLCLCRTASLRPSLRCQFRWAILHFCTGSLEENMLPIPTSTGPNAYVRHQHVCQCW